MVSTWLTLVFRNVYICLAQHCLTGAGALSGNLKVSLYRRAPACKIPIAYTMDDCCFSPLLIAGALPSMVVVSRILAPAICMMIPMSVLRGFG